eukprot:CAMPEP_0167806692 /NCGR_PEP_ID=MMETSP0111_2-20121227/22008_1 /TAXON_ID=91324 /ORGANISM="Lotharella globosa, Strain CCCM811" /LENGTH=236 /DNA_ID=CAMNT_0007704251 /DNA_START=36 /DNA_END=743 /DNA_ORIENTATION=-
MNGRAFSPLAGNPNGNPLQTIPESPEGIRGKAEVKSNGRVNAPADVKTEANLRFEKAKEVYGSAKPKQRGLLVPETWRSKLNIDDLGKSIANLRHQPCQSASLKSGKTIFKKKKKIKRPKTCVSGSTSLAAMASSNPYIRSAKRQKNPMQKKPTPTPSEEGPALMDTKLGGDIVGTEPVAAEKPLNAKSSGGMDTTQFVSDGDQKSMNFQSAVASPPDLAAGDAQRSGQRETPITP